MATAEMVTAKVIAPITKETMASDMTMVWGKPWSVEEGKRVYLHHTPDREPHDRPWLLMTYRAAARMTQEQAERYFKVVRVTSIP